jgi:hypothetical protein
VEPETRIEVDYQLEFTEFYRGLRWYAWRKCWWLYFILIFGFPVILMTTVFRPDDTRSHPVVAVLSGLLTAILVAAGVFWGVRRNARKQFNSSESLRVARHSVYSDEGVEGSSKLSSGKTSWAVLHQVLETPESFLFFASNATFGVVPKRAFGTEERVKNLRELIQKQVGAKAKLRSR